MRTSEYYAQGISSFFIGYGLDAVERHHDATEAPEKAETEPIPGLRTDEDDMHFDDYTPDSCQCLATAYPPCHYCEYGGDERGE